MSQPKTKSFTSIVIASLGWPLFWGLAATFTFYLLIAWGVIQSQMVSRYFAGHPVDEIVSRILVRRNFHRFATQAGRLQARARTRIFRGRGSFVVEDTLFPQAAIDATRQVLLTHAAEKCRQAVIVVFTPLLK